MLIDAMLGLWNDAGASNLDQQSRPSMMLESAIQEYRNGTSARHLPGARLAPGPCASSSAKRNMAGEYVTQPLFTLAKLETSLALYLFPEMVRWSTRQTRSKATCLEGSLRTSVDPTAGPAAGPRARATSPSKSPRPRRGGWGMRPTHGPLKAKRPWRPILALFLTLLHDDISIFVSRPAKCRRWRITLAPPKRWNPTCAKRRRGLEVVLRPAHDRAAL